MRVIEKFFSLDVRGVMFNNFLLNWFIVIEFVKYLVLHYIRSNAVSAVVLIGIISVHVVSIVFVL
jgi:hypothetical protein